MSVTTMSIHGVEAIAHAVRVTLTRGSRVTSAVGLTADQVAEVSVRVRSAIQNSGASWPSAVVCVDVAPAARGTGFDLAVALAVLAADGQISPVALENVVVVGELGLDGRVRGVRGGLPIGLAAMNACARVLCPADMADEILAAGAEPIPIFTLAEAIQWARGDLRPPRHVLPPPRQDRDDAPDLADVRGQTIARRALEIAAAGGHNLLFIGPPGAGRTMLARRLTTILPPMTETERLEASVVASVAGLLRPEEPLLARRPFRAPHHSVSDVAMIGGGVQCRPGELSLATHGVLFLDELPEFRRSVLEPLPGVLRAGEVAVGRAGQTVHFPARCQVVASMNPCPCGYYGHPRQGCSCSETAIRAYRARITAPVRELFDLVVELPAVSADELRIVEPGESSASVRARVEFTRGVLAPLEPLVTIEPSVNPMLGRINNQDRALWLARTIAANDGRTVVAPSDLAEALAYQRNLL